MKCHRRSYEVSEVDQCVCVRAEYSILRGAVRAGRGSLGFPEGMLMKKNDEDWERVSEG